jgi:hypothetical protein
MDGCSKKSDLKNEHICKPLFYNILPVKHDTIAVCTPDNFVSLEVTNTNGSKVCFYVSTSEKTPYPNVAGI